MLKEFNIGELTFNPFERIGNDWCLISAGTEDSFNTMTASWGGVGILWGKEVATCYIRPQRYTKQFVDGSDCFTLTFFPDGYKKALGLCGRVSGRDHDKPKEAGLTPCSQMERSLLRRQTSSSFAESSMHRSLQRIRLSIRQCLNGTIPRMTFTQCTSAR